MAANIQDAIMVLGDSLTQGGWEPLGLTQRLAAVYVRKLDVINRGFSGYITEWAIPVFEQIFAKQHEQQHVPKVRILAIWYGANDAAPAPSIQHVPRDKFKSNLSHLIHMVNSPTSAWYSPDTRIILVTPPPVNTFQWPERVFDATKSYAEAVKEVGVQENIPVADIWTAMWDASGHEEKALSNFLYDGLHLNGDGYFIVYNSIMQVVKDKYPELHYDNIVPGFVPWDEVNPKDPRSSLENRSGKGA